MSINNKKGTINTISIDDVNVDNLGQGYVDDDNNNKVEVKEEPKHFLQVLREAIDKQIKIIEEEKKAKARLLTSKYMRVSNHMNLVAKHLCLLTIASLKTAKIVLTLMNTKLKKCNFTFHPSLFPFLDLLIKFHKLLIVLMSVI